MSVYTKLLNVQNELKAEKTHYNEFGKYYYRNCEDIMAGAKPLCHAAGLLLTITDTIEMIGTRYYVKATANIMDTETGDTLTVTASAREEESKKGMDGSQVTGAASSYARKYALNGLFAIDDTKDADGLPPETTKSSAKPNTPKANENATTGQETPNNGTQTQAPISEARMKRMYTIASKKGRTESQVNDTIKAKYHVKEPNMITVDQYNHAVKAYEDMSDAAK